jgi:Aerotolerance regulator N-terminal
MGLLNPGALIFFAIVPVLVLAWLARERPARIVVSSVLAFRALHAMRKERFGGFPKLDWSFFVELLILILAVLAMARPYLIRHGNPIAIVLDNSARMQARASDGTTRFEQARKETDAMLSNTDASTVALYLTAPQPHQVNGAPLSPTDAHFQIAEAKVSDAPTDPAAVANLLGELSSSGRVSKVIFASSRPLAPPAPPRIDAITVGDPIENFAIGSFTLRRETFGAEALHARLTVANFSPQLAEIAVSVSGDGKQLGTAKTSLGPRETGVVEFPSLGAAEVYKAELSPSDGFPLDNIAFATAGSVKSVSILFVSPHPGDAQGLDSIPGVTVATKSPDAFAPADLNNIDLAIFEFAAPKELPTVNSMLVMPPAGDPVFGFNSASVEPVQITKWSPIDPLTDAVNFRLLNIRQGEVFGSHPWMESVVGGAGGSLLLRGERQGHRFVATGFNPFPYLGKRNLPMSIVTLNALGYLAGVGANSGGYRTGEPWLVPAGVHDVVLPSGKEVPAKSGTLFSEVAAQGIYKLIGPGKAETLRAVNLADLTTSDFENVPPLKIEAAKAAVTPETLNEKAPLTAYILAAILALLALEAMLLYRRRRSPLEA